MGIRSTTGCRTRDVLPGLHPYSVPGSSDISPCDGLSEARSTYISPRHDPRKKTHKTRVYVSEVRKHHSDCVVEVMGEGMVTHLKGVASTPCLINLRLDRVLLGKLEVENDL